MYTPSWKRNDESLTGSHSLCTYFPVCTTWAVSSHRSVHFQGERTRPGGQCRAHRRGLIIFFWPPQPEMFLDLLFYWFGYILKTFLKLHIFRVNTKQYALQLFHSLHAVLVPFSHFTCNLSDFTGNLSSIFLRFDQSSLHFIDCKVPIFLISR